MARKIVNAPAQSEEENRAGGSHDTPVETEQSRTRLELFLASLATMVKISFRAKPKLLAKHPASTGKVLSLMRSVFLAFSIFSVFNFASSPSTISTDYFARNDVYEVAQR